jgi:acyl-CoA thioesterase FadM
MELIKHQKVGSSIADPLANLSVMGIFQIAEEAVTELMGELEIDDIVAKREYNAVWVFAKSKTEIYKNIVWNEDYTVDCFISKITRASISIDVGIKNKTDELCSYTRVELCALDLQSGRIRKVSTVGVDDSMEVHTPLADISFTKFDSEDLPEADMVKVKYTNIDFAGHTNNKEYIRFMLNTYSAQELQERPIREIEVVYINQSFENDILTVHKGSFDDKDILEVRKEDKPIVKCEIVRGDNG